MFRRSFAVVFGAALASLLLVDHPLCADESYTFRYRLPQVGDETTNDVQFVLDLLTTTRQGGQPVGNALRQIRSTNQRRRITVLEAAGGTISKVRLVYNVAEQLTKQEGREDLRIPQVVSGKTYLVQRAGSRLVVTDELGRTPPPEEVDIVAGNMTALGRGNPLARFLNDKSLTIGQSISLPNEMAAELLGLAGTLDEVTRVEMTLSRVRHVNGFTLATIQTRLEGHGGERRQMKMRVAGRLLVEVDTCQIVELEFFGPVSISQTHGAADVSYTITAAGTLEVWMRRRASGQPF